MNTKFYLRYPLASIPVILLGIIVLSLFIRQVQFSATEPTIKYRVNAGGPRVNGTVSWAEDTRSRRSGYGKGGITYAVKRGIDLSHPSLPVGMAGALFKTQRWYPKGSANTQWKFPVAPGTYEVRLYFAETYIRTQSKGARVFDVSIEDLVVLDNYDIYADVGGYKGVMKAFVVTVDDRHLDIHFGHVTENPVIMAIEIRRSEGPAEEGAVEEASSKAPPALNTVRVPQPKNLRKFVRNKKHALLLGKALFFDQQAGSDGQACASCHFHAGADSRVKNQLTPGRNGKFERTASGGMGGPNYTLVKDDFPFHKLRDPDNRNSKVLHRTDETASSQGVFNARFVDGPGLDESDDVCEGGPDPVFHVVDVNTLQVEPRHTPTNINAVFNHRNFWDGRANNSFNGIDPFGRRNRDARVIKSDGSSIKVDLRNSSLASQAVGPPVNANEMSCAGRKFAQVGKKLIPRQALALQRVHRGDSVLGGRHRHRSGKGLRHTYEELIKKAFKPVFWNSSRDFDGYSQMERNFSLFWGISIQLYQATLVSDRAPYDRFAARHKSSFDPDKGNRRALTSAQFRGLKIFLDKGKCINCHKGPEFSGAASVLQAEEQEDGLVERMVMGDRRVALYDNGFYNIGVTPTKDDLGVGGKDPFGKPLSFTEQFVRNRFVDRFRVDPCTFEVPFFKKNCKKLPHKRALRKERTAVKGAFKVPILRNVELTGPFMHNGSMATLEQVVDFYNRGGNFRNRELDPDIQPLGLTRREKADLVAFLKSLTDPRVTNEAAPFDHPELFVPKGHKGDDLVAIDADKDGRADRDMVTIPAVGKRGRRAEGLSRLKPFHVNLRGTPRPISKRVQKPKSGYIDGWTLVDATTDRDITLIKNGGKYALAGKSIAVRVDSPKAKRVKINTNGMGINHSRTERLAPYASFGDTRGNYSGKVFAAGKYRVKASALVNGKVVEEKTISFWIN